MVKSGAESNKEQKSISKKDPVCQNCRFHTNKPSRCGITSKFTPRKNTCDLFKI